MVKLLDLKAAAKALKVSPFTLRDWARQGRVPVTRLGRRLHFDPVALTAWIAERTTRRR